MPFSSEPRDRKPKKGLKINNEQSSIPVPKDPNASEFNQAADRAFARNEDYKKRSVELTAKFSSMMDDRVLPDNKTIIVKDLEQEVQSQLSKLAMEMNKDEGQPEGIGSVILVALLMKMCVRQRDQINLLSYKITQLENLLAASQKQTG